MRAFSATGTVPINRLRAFEWNIPHYTYVSGYRRLEATPVPPYKLVYLSTA